MATLREVIETARPYPDAPEQFTFGLLERFDLDRIASMIPPGTIRLDEASDRAKKTLGR